LERTIDAVENSRDLLVGSLEIYLGRVGQRTNEMVKSLTLLSAVPAPCRRRRRCNGHELSDGILRYIGQFLDSHRVMIVLGASALVIAKLRKWI
jgi:magnesium transporter